MLKYSSRHGNLSHDKEDVNLVKVFGLKFSDICAMDLETYNNEHFYSGADTPIQLGPNILLEHITYS